MKLSSEDFGLSHLHEHLQFAVNLELWTIPYYLSAMYSVVDKHSDAYQLIRTIANQEMLHLQSAANMTNAYGLVPTISIPQYVGTTVPHLDFSLDPTDVTKQFMPYSAEIGPLDMLRMNAMCLIELPEFDTDDNSTPDLHDDTTEYGTIGAFYQALLHGARLHKNAITGGVRQVNYFAPFYRNAPNLTVSESGANGFNQVEFLINLITEQGEGFSKKAQVIPPVYQNTADDIEPSTDHFKKFLSIKESKTQQLTFAFKDPCSYNEEDKKLQQILIAKYANLTAGLQALFNGDDPSAFFPDMASVGGAIRNCWQNGVVPKFS